MKTRIALLTALAATAANADTINVPGDYPTIQIAVNIAQNGDTINVAPGTYFEDITLLSKELTLVAAGGPGVTTIRGEGLPLPVIDASSATATIEGFTISSITPDDNPSKYGGGLYATGNTILTISDCVFDSNFAGMDNGGGGAALWLNNADTTFINTTFSNNVSNWQGGAVRINSGYATFVNCALTDCESVDGGGAVYAEGGAILSFHGCSIQNNVSAKIGGGVRVVDCDLTIRDSLLFNNSAAEHGGGLAASTQSDTLLERTRFESNAAGRGGATYTNLSPLEMNNCVFVANSATVYGGASYVAGVADVDNCTFYSNSAPNGIGSAFESAGGGSKITCNNSIFVGATPTKSGAGFTTYAYCNLPDAPNGSGNISIDPMFVNAISGDYHLAAGSPCIDAGDTGFVLTANPDDFDGNPRAVDDPDVQNTGVTLLGLTVDMGAYEAQSDETPCIADANGDGMLNILDFVTFQGLFQAGCP